VEHRINQAEGSHESVDRIDSVFLRVIMIQGGVGWIGEAQLTTKTPHRREVSMIFVSLFFGAVALIVIVLFSIQNAAPVTVWFYNWKFDASLAIVVFLSVIVGMLVETLFMVSLRLRKAMKRRGQKKDLREEQGERPSPENANSSQ
jgi:lipopolysaccharide assembly protein A